MLLKRSIKKIILSSFALLLLLLMYLIPTTKEDNKYDYVIEYVNKELKTHKIFLLDNNNNLSQTEVIIQSDDKKKLAYELINYLIIDSSYADKIPSGFRPFLNSNTTINSIEVIDDTIKIDFNDALLDVKKNMEEKVIEAIIYNLTSIDDINNIIIYIDGTILNYLPKNKITLPSTLTRNFGINKEYNITSNNNITKTTVYYISNFNDQIYYTPITKVMNNDDDKVKIIIEELKDNTTLSSYLNYNTKLVDMNIDNNNLILDFNEYILDDIETYNILDEVIDTISLSIHDNYDINDIIFKVNGREIYKNKNKVLNN